MALVWPTESGQDRHPGCLESSRQLEDLAEFGKATLAFALVRMVRSHRFEVLARDVENIREDEPAATYALFEPTCCPGNIAKHICRLNPGNAAGEAEVVPVETEPGHELDALIVWKSRERVVTAGKAHVQPSHRSKRLQPRLPPMNQLEIGDSRPTVSSVGLGCNNFGVMIGRGMNARVSRTVIDAAYDAGITLFDTADVYAEGVSERFLGEALIGRRDRVVLAT